MEEQQSQLNQYECAAGQCVSELQKAQLQVQSLQAKIHESEANNMVKTHTKRHFITGGSCLLQAHLRPDDSLTVISVSALQKLQEKLNEMECELRSLRQAAQNQERTIQGLNESINTKDNEVRVFLVLSDELCQTTWQDLCSNMWLVVIQGPGAVPDDRRSEHHSV